MTPPTPALAKNPKPVKAWAIAGPSNIIACGLTKDAAWAEAEWETGINQKKLEGIGSRCIRVTIVP